MFVEARLLGRNCLGAEIDPLSRLISTVKATPLDASSIDAAFEAVGETYLATLGRVIQREPTLSVPDFPNKDYWFNDDVQGQLTALCAAIADIEAPLVRNLFLVVFSSVIIAKGPSTVANALDIAHSRAHHVERSTVPDVWSRFSERYRRARKAIEAFSRDATSTVTTALAAHDARALPYRSQSVGAVVTSPPYVTAIEYPRSHKFSVWWIGHLIGATNRIYEDIQHKYIGTELVSKKDGLVLREQSTGSSTADRVARELDQVDEERARRVRRYFRDMKQALAEALRTLAPGRPAVLVLADSVMRGVTIPTATCLTEIAEALEMEGSSFQHKSTFTRVIRERSRQLPIKRGANGDAMHTEQVIVLERQATRRLVTIPSLSAETDLDDSAMPLPIAV